MQVDPLVALQLDAFRLGRAVPAYTHRRVAVQPHALVVAVVALAGDDATVHAAALGWARRPQPFRIVTMPDPLERQASDLAFAALGTDLARYYEWCESHSAFPQLVVTGPAAAQHLAILADSFRFFTLPVSTHAGPETARVRTALGEFAADLSYVTTRAAVEGQQSLVAVSDLLATHWALPLPPAHAHHLGAVLSCIDPSFDAETGRPGRRGVGTPLHERLNAARAVPMGPDPDPNFDNETMAPRLFAYREARRRGRPEPVLEGLRESIAEALMPAVTRMHAAAHHGLNVLRCADLPPLPILGELVAAEATSFGRFRSNRAHGRLTPLRDQAVGAAYRVVQRTEARATLEAAVACFDALGRARAVHAGEALAGRVVAARREIVPGRRTPVLMIEVVTSQAGLRLRERDELVLIDGSRAKFVVQHLAADAGQPFAAAARRVTLRMIRGMKRVGLPAVGRSLVLVRRLPEPGRVGRMFGAMRDKLTALPWTHADRPAPGRRDGVPDLLSDPLLALEAFR